MIDVNKRLVEVETVLEKLDTIKQKEYLQQLKVILWLT